MVFSNDNFNIFPFARYLRHVRNATDSERAGGFMSELACGRAIQDAFSALYLGAEL